MAEIDLLTASPIDLAEHLAAAREWPCDRIGGDQLAMAVDGQWKTYSVTLAWSERDRVLMCLCSHEFAPPAERAGVVLELLNLANDSLWSGAFLWWTRQELLVFRDALAIGDELPEAGQVDGLVAGAVEACERFYPAFQLVAWGDRSAEEAVGMAMEQPWGHA